MGKVIYQPKGKAAEYSAWAANFYNGCSARCEYCFNRKGRSAKVLGGDEPTLKKSLVTEEQALHYFKIEVEKNVEELRKHGLFFNFVSDPFLPETSKLTWKAAFLASELGVKIKFLTKQTKWVDPYLKYYTQLTAKKYLKVDQEYYHFGFTLTGHDSLEPGAATNAERIEAMRKLHDAGFKTWASIEPIIDFESSLRMIQETAPVCKYFKIGIKSGDKHHFELVRSFLDDVFEILPTKPIYLKDSLLKQAGIRRDSFELPTNCVTRDFNL